MASSDGGSGDNVGFFGLLALLFIGLKLGNVIAWSWTWVLAPIWIPVIVAVLVGVVAAVVAIMASR